MLKSGDQIGKYRIEKELGKGAAGSVFKAHDDFLDVDVCIKVLHKELSSDLGVLKRLVMEYVPGVTLASILNKGAISIERSLKIVRDIAEGLVAAHAVSVIHRDLKPGNIIIGEAGENDKVTLVDFGVATTNEGDRLTRPGVMVGSLSYIAPEVWKGAKADAQADVWALGIIFYGCLTGALPYTSPGFADLYKVITTTTPKKPSAFDEQISIELESVVFSCMCVDKTKRFKSAQEVIDAIDRLTHDVEIKSATSAMLSSKTKLDLSDTEQNTSEGGEGDPVYDRVAVLALAKDAQKKQDKTQIITPEENAKIRDEQSKDERKNKTQLIEVERHNLDEKTSVFYSRTWLAMSLVIVALLLIVVFVLWPKGSTSANEVVAEAYERESAKSLSDDKKHERAEIADPVQKIDDLENDVSDDELNFLLSDIEIDDESDDIEAAAKVEPVSAPKVNRSGARAYQKMLRSYGKTMSRRGLIWGDVPLADRTQKSARRSARQKHYNKAERKLKSARELLLKTNIDDAFIKRKLERFNRLYDRKDKAAQDRAAPLSQAIFASKDNAKTNAALNRAFRALAR